MKMKGTIKCRHVFVEQKNTGERSMIFCDTVEYMHDRGTFMGHPTFDHHLMFWLGKKLVFKVWLRQDREYKNINEALEDVGMAVFK